jgi:hypothetical protein
MERRDALKSLAALAGATGLSVTPVTARDAEADWSVATRGHVELILLKVNSAITAEASMRLKAGWERAVDGTALKGVKTVVVDEGIEVEFVRR